VRQEKEKRSMNQRHESIMKEKSDRILQLEQRREEVAQNKKEMPVANAHAQMQSCHPIPAHTFVCALPSVLPAFVDQQSSLKSKQSRPRERDVPI